jgi:ABC-type Mn2+/Zn2+ transport system permease subunit
MMALAATIASISGVIGLYLSFYLGIASGSAVVLTCTGIFVVVWVIQSLRKAI